MGRWPHCKFATSVFATYRHEPPAVDLQAARPRPELASFTTPQPARKTTVTRAATRVKVRSRAVSQGIACDSSDGP